MSEVKSDLPLIPLRDVVVFPGIVTTLFVGRPKSIEALNVAMSSNKKLVLVSQKDASLEDPKISDIYKFASISNLLQLIKYLCLNLIQCLLKKYYNLQKLK